MAGVASSSRQRSKIAPYLMVLPALAYLAIFFVVPFFSLARTSLSETAGSVFMPTLTFAWDFGNYAEAFTLYRELEADSGMTLLSLVGLINIAPEAENAAIRPVTVVPAVRLARTGTVLISRPRSAACKRPRRRGTRSAGRAGLREGSTAAGPADGVSEARPAAAGAKAATSA